jgi:predicted TIM-barrel fold metal-dependent hydrolase
MRTEHIKQIQPAAQPGTPIAFDVPEGACDCLTHIFGDPVEFPMSPGRTYTPPPASVAEILSMLAALHFSRVVIVHPTIYGTDNSCTIDAVRRLGANARGVAVIDGNTSDAALDEMHAAGIRGIRINLETIRQADPAVARERLQDAIARVRRRPGWHLQIYARPTVFQAVRDLIETCPVHVSLDHFAGLRAADGIEHPGFGLLVDFLRAGIISVKLSAPYLASTLGPDFPDLDRVARALVAANPERILWATNWPHPDSGKDGPKRPFDVVTPLRQPDDGAILNLLTGWVPDAATRRAILVDNPARLFGF